MLMTFRIIVAGSKHYNNQHHLNNVLDSLFEKHGKLMIFEDGASPVTKFARMWAKENNLHTISTYANEEEFGDGAKFQQIKTMISYFPHLVLIFSAGLETENMVEQARQAGIQIRVEK